MEEKVINGVLCFYENKKWTPYTLESLTTAFRAMRSMYESADRRVNKLERIIENIRKALI